MYPFAKPKPFKFNIADPMLYAKYLSRKEGFHLNNTSANHLVNLVYGYMSEDSFDENVTLAARGMLIDKEMNQIVIRPIHKFFNVGERPNTGFVDLPWDQLIGIEIKHDATNVNVTIYDGELIVKTKNSIDNNICEHVKKIFKKQQPAFYRYLQEADERDKRLTVSFEFFHNLDESDQVVNIATEEKFVPLYLIDNVTGDYANFSPEPIGGHPALVEIQKGLLDLLSVPKRTEKMYLDIFDRDDLGEGVVLKFNDEVNGQVWYKFKTSKYMRIHRAISRLSSARILNMYLDEELDDVKAHLEQRKDTFRLDAIDFHVERIKTFLTEFNNKVQEVKDMNLTSRELHELTKTNEYAMAANPKVVPERIKKRFLDLYKHHFTNDVIEQPRG